MFDTFNNLDDSLENYVSKKSQSQKVTYYRFLYTTFWNEKILEIDNRFVVARN